MSRCKCGNDIPQGRVALGFFNCVSCSSTEMYSYVPIIYHKTGNTIQIVDQATSKAVHKSWRRK